jgi:hypothetical protein
MPSFFCRTQWLSGAKQIAGAVACGHRAARAAIENDHAQSLLDLQDMTTQGCLLDPELVRSPIETPRFGSCNKIAKLAELDHIIREA